MNETTTINSGADSTGHACHDKNCGNSKKCGCAHHMVIPTLIILIGLNILLGALVVYSDQITTIISAIILILIGGVKLKSKMCKCC